MSALRAKVKPLHEAEPDERLERPVDACDADSRPGGTIVLLAAAAFLAASGVRAVRAR